MVKDIFSFDLRSLALFRICLGLLILFDLSSRIPDLLFFYTHQGLLPLDLYFSAFMTTWNVSLYFLNDTVAITALLFVITALSAAALLVGCRTRLATFLSWLLVMSLHIRNPLVNNNGDHLLEYLLFWSIFLPLGAVCSLDRGWNLSFKVNGKKHWSLASVAYFLQVGFIYWFAALFKYQDPLWRQGDGVWCSLNNLWASTSLGTELLRFPGILKILNHAVVGFEFFGPFLFFIPVFLGPIRTAAILGFLFLQAGFGIFLSLGLFPFISTAATIPFIPGWLWGKLPVVLGRRCPHQTPRKIRERPLPLWANALALFFLIYVFIWNLWTLNPRFEIQQPFDALGDLFSVGQTWSVFAPAAPYNNWLVIPGKLNDGTLVDLANSGEPFQWERSALREGLYKNSRWRLYLLRLSGEDYRAHYPYLANYLCRRWNSDHQGPQRLEALDLYAVSKVFYPKPEPIETFWLYGTTCPKES